MGTSLSDIRLAELLRPGLLRQLAQAELALIKETAKGLPPAERVVYLRCKLAGVEALLQPVKARPPAPAAPAPEVLDALLEEDLALDEAACDRAVLWPCHGGDDDIDVRAPAGAAPEQGFRSDPAECAPAGAPLPDRAPVAGHGTDHPAEPPAAEAPYPAPAPEVTEPAGLVRVLDLVDELPPVEAPPGELLYAADVPLAEIAGQGGRRTPRRRSLQQLDRAAPAAPKRRTRRPR